MNEHTCQLHGLGQFLWLDQVSRRSLRIGVADIASANVSTPDTNLRWHAGTGITYVAPPFGRTRAPSNCP